MKFLSILFLMAFILLWPGAVSQHIDDTHEHEGDHNHSLHEHRHKNEIGFGAGWARILNESKNAAGFHLHYLRSLGEKEKFSLGPGIELIMDEFYHTSLVISIGYRPVHPLYLAISPGFAFPLKPDDHHAELEFATHFEILYEFEFDFIHIGPMIEYSLGVEDRHVLAALHLGFNF